MQHTNKRRIVPSHFIEQYKLNGENDFSTPIKLHHLGKTCIQTAMLGGHTVAIFFVMETSTPLRDRLKRYQNQ